MFWKKKPKEPVFDCRGVNYLKVLENNGEKLDEAKEELLDYFKSKSKVYTKAEIDLMTEKLGYNIWDSFIWVDIAKLENLKTSIKSQQRWLGLKEMESEELAVDAADALKGKLNTRDFYTRAQIQTISGEVGFDVYNRSEWQSYSYITYTFADGTTTEFFSKK